MRGKLWRKKTGELTHWTWNYYWHAVNKDGECCWVLEGLSHLERNPYNQGVRGGKLLNISSEDKIKRLHILMRHAKYTQKIRQAMETGNVDRVIRFANSIEKLKEEITPYGGIPKKWITEIDQSITKS